VTKVKHTSDRRPKTTYTGNYIYGTESQLAIITFDNNYKKILNLSQDKKKVLIHESKTWSSLSNDKLEI